MTENRSIWAAKGMHIFGIEFILVFIATPWVQSLPMHGNRSLVAQPFQQPKTPYIEANKPIYMEVFGTRGINQYTVESNFMNTLNRRHGAFKLVDNDLVMHDELYRTRMLNYLNVILEKKSANCKRNRDCISAWLRDITPEEAENLHSLYKDSMARGCMTLGGCKTAMSQTMQYHIRRDDNMLMESTGGLDLAAVQDRMAQVSGSQQYRLRVFGLICSPYNEAQSQIVFETANLIYKFMQNPKRYPAPKFGNFVNLKTHVRDTLCIMSGFLDCLSKRTRHFINNDGQQYPCEPVPDGMYVWAHAVPDPPRLVAFAQNGGTESDENFVKARELIRRSMPTDVPPCLAVDLE